MPMVDDYGSGQSHSSAEVTSLKKSTTDSVPERYELHPIFLKWDALMYIFYDCAVSKVLHEVLV